MTSSNAAEALHAALVLVRPRAASLTNGDLAVLRKRLYAAVDDMQADGISPTQAAIIVKGLAAVVGLQWISMDLVDQLASWCAERYGQRDDATANGLEHPARLTQFPE